MFLAKIKNRESGVLIYGITPPKATTPYEKVCEIAAKNVSRLAGQDIDALIVYDVQDEAERTQAERPFPFSSSMDPLIFTSQHLSSLDIPKIIYRPASKFTREELRTWLGELKALQAYPVFVGLPTPDFVPKTSLNEAYQIWRDNHVDHSVIGAVTIPERHAVLKDEHVRMIDKMSNGVSYFVSQCIFDIDYAKRMLDDLAAGCREKSLPVPCVVFTLTICGSAKTLEFMEWLGIHIPPAIKEELKRHPSPVAHSVGLATVIASELISYCKKLSVPVGFNIESVAIRREEIEASFFLLAAVRELLVKNGLRQSRNGREAAAIKASTQASANPS
jgi:5,10-methylenetetrahydrofolate reductase